MMIGLDDDEGFAQDDCANMLHSFCDADNQMIVPTCFIPFAMQIKTKKTLIDTRGPANDGELTGVKAFSTLKEIHGRMGCMYPLPDHTIALSLPAQKLDGSA
eukprot:scaffold89536_cov15-Tisochrysis_lutea.AAC.1